MSPVTYTVVDAEKKSDKPDKGYGPMQVISLALKDNENGAWTAEWFTKAATAVPQPGAQLVGEVSEGQYGWQFKKAAPLTFGAGSKEYKADPVKQAAIAMEHAQKAAIDILRLAVENSNRSIDDGYQLPDTVGGISEQVKMVAKKLYDQITEVSEAAK